MLLDYQSHAYTAAIYVTSLANSSQYSGRSSIKQRQNCQILTASTGFNSHVRSCWLEA